MQGTALVIGSNGQDGSYMAGILLERGYRVIGIARQNHSRWVNHPEFRHVKLDASDARQLGHILNETNPDRIFALAAVHGASGYSYEANWRECLNVNIGSVHTCLEYLRRDAPTSRLFIASSVKAFGDTPPALIDELTPRVSSCLYGVTKNAAADVASYYRTRHRISVCIGYFFNHDSPRRPLDYFLPQLVAQLASHLRGEQPTAPLATLDFWCDWGSSPEFMHASTTLVERDEPSDLVIASGTTIYAGDLVAALSEAAGTPAHSWVRAVKPAQSAPAPPPYRAKIDNLRKLIGEPKSDGLDVALWILRERYGVSLNRPPGWTWDGQAA